MDDVAREAEYTKKTLYAYFSSKEQLYNAIILRAYRILNTTTEAMLQEHTLGNGLDKINLLLRSYIKGINKYPHYFMAIIEYQNRDEDFDTADEIIKTCYAEGEVITARIIAFLKEGVTDGSLRQDLDVHNAYLFLYGNLIGIGTLILNKEKYITHTLKKPIPELVEGVFDLMIRSIQAI